MSNTEIQAAAETRNIETITAEILQLKVAGGEAILGIGQRLQEAKDMLDHGEWITWLSEEVDFSVRTAQRFMRLASEWSNATALSHLGATKALALLALPAEDRDEFIETHPVQDMSTRELQEAIKERDEAKKAQEKAEAELEELKAFNTSTLEAQAKARKDLAEAKAALKELQDRPVEVAVEVDEKAVEAARKEAREKAIAEMQKKVTAAQNVAEKAEKAREDAERALDAAQKRIQEQKSSVGAAAISGDKDLTVFEVYFAQAQEAINKMHGILLKVRGKDEDKAAKLTAALKALADNVGRCAG